MAPSRGGRYTHQNDAFLKRDRQRRHESPQPRHSLNDASRHHLHSKNHRRFMIGIASVWRWAAGSALMNSRIVMWS